MSERFYQPMRRRHALAQCLFLLLAWFFGLASLAIPVAILLFLAVKGAPVISWEFLSAAPGGFPIGNGGGIWPAIEGSLLLVGLGLAFAAPAAILGAAYLSEFCRSAILLRWVRGAAEMLVAVPSILYGLFGYAFLVVLLNLKVTLLAGAITLGLLMAPMILIGAHEAMRSVDPALRQATMALGVTRSRFIGRILLPHAAPAILSVTLLAAMHAFGSAAPVLLTAAIMQSAGDIGLLTPTMTLPTHLFYLVGEAVSLEHGYGTALVLVTLVLAGNFAAVSLKFRLGYMHD